VAIAHREMRFCVRFAEKAHHDSNISVVCERHSSGAKLVQQEARRGNPNYTLSIRPSYVSCDERTIESVCTKIPFMAKCARVQHNYG
jgi:hypothetical protein